MDSEPENDDELEPELQEDSIVSADQLSEAFAQLMSEPEDEVSQQFAADSSQPIQEGEQGELQVASVEEDEDDSPVSPESILESMLFVGHPENQPLTNRVLASFMRGVSPNEIDELVADLNERYQDQETAYEIVSDGPGYRMALRPEFESVRNRFYGKVREVRLSQTAIDILAIVAYNQPVDRKEIDKLRGKPSGGMLNQLVRRDLISVERTKERPIRTLYRTTDRFLAFLNIDSVDDLPIGEDF